MTVTVMRPLDLVTESAFSQVPTDFPSYRELREKLGLLMEEYRMADEKGRGRYWGSVIVVFSKALGPAVVADLDFVWRVSDILQGRADYLEHLPQKRIF